MLVHALFYSPVGWASSLLLTSMPGIIDTNNHLFYENKPMRLAYNLNANATKIRFLRFLSQLSAIRKFSATCQSRLLLTN